MVNILQQLTQNWPAIIALGLTEISLSGDNALVNAAMANALPKEQQRKAIFFGIGAGAILRLVALALASFIMKWPAIQLVGGAYLVYLAISHLVKKNEEDDGKVQLKSRFWPVIISIAIADISFSMDNIVAAVGLSRYFVVVATGVLIGILAMMFLTQAILVLVQRYPKLETTAYCIVGFIGLTIFSDILFKRPVSDVWKLILIVSAVGFTIIYEEIAKRNQVKAAI